MRFNFDMDGTIANLYGVENWLEKLQTFDSSPYQDAKPLVNMARLAKALHKVQRKGHKIVILSWMSKDNNADYNKKVANAKKEWLARHLPSVQWDEILIVTYGTPKQKVSNGILFDDEELNRKNWGKGAYKPTEIFAVLAEG